MNLAKQLEALIDQYSLATLMAEISDICLEKSEHIETNWQDSDAASPWRHAGVRIARGSKQWEQC